MTYTLINELSESSLFPSHKSLEKYEPQDISELAYLHILALYILMSEEYSRKWTQEYCKRTTRGLYFRKWRSDATDLYVLMHVLSDDKEKLHDKDHDAGYYRDGLLISPNVVYRWILSGISGHFKESETKSIFLKIDNMFRVHNTSIKAVRRLVQDWPKLSFSDKRFAMTRLINLFRQHTSNSEILTRLLKLSAARALDLPVTDDAEPKKIKSLLVSLVKNAGLINRALKKESASIDSARKMREGTEWKTIIETPDLLQIIRDIHHNRDDFEDGDLEERLWKYDQYVLRSVPISKIKDIERFCSDDDPMVDDYIAMPADTMPPIVLTYGYRIIDGAHRAYAAKKRGMTHISAYVGVKVSESASSGGTSSASVAVAVGGIGAGFDDNYEKSVYPAPKKKEQKKKKVLSRLAETAFMDWFAGSKIVDVSGKPLKVYHGTGSSFEDFDLEKAGFNTGGSKAFFFTDNTKVASKYASMHDEPSIVPVYLSIQNPYVFDANESQIGYLRTKTDKRYSVDQLLSLAKRNGCDGLIIKNVKSLDMICDAYVALQPSQIKSAVSNSGSYDKDNAKISEGLEREYHEPF